MREHHLIFLMSTLLLAGCAGTSPAPSTQPEPPASAESTSMETETEAPEAPAEGMADSGTQSPEAIEILKKVDAATKAVTSVRYQAKSVPSGIATNFISEAEGGGVMVGWDGARPQKFYARVKTSKPGSGEPMELTGGGDGDTYFVIDHTAKKAYEDMDPLVLGSGANALLGLGMAEFVHPTPFDDEMNGDTVELQGTEKVGDEECYKVHVVYSGGRGSSTWLFSKEDMLPRRRVRHFNVPQQGEGSVEITLTELEVDPEIDASAFKLKLPEGYEQIDDFMP